MPRLTAQLTLLPTEQGGKTRPVAAGYRPQFVIDDTNESTSFLLDLIQGREVLGPGETGIVEGCLLHPEFFKGRLVPGAKFEIREGRTAVGRGVLQSVDY